MTKLVVKYLNQLGALFCGVPVDSLGSYENGVRNSGSSWFRYIFGCLVKKHRNYLQRHCVWLFLEFDFTTVSLSQTPFLISATACGCAPERAKEAAQRAHPVRCRRPLRFKPRVHTLLRIYIKAFRQDLFPTYMSIWAQCSRLLGSRPPGQQSEGMPARKRRREPPVAKSFAPPSILTFIPIRLLPTQIF